MAIEILMPALSPTMTEGNLAKWHKKEGDKVEPGEVIAEIETDKATMEVEAVDEGTIGKILIQEKTEGVKVNALIAVLLEEGEDKSAMDDLISKAKDSTANESAPAEEAQKEEPEVDAPPPIPGSQTQTEASKPAPAPAPQITVPETQAGTRIFASPLAKRIAEQQGVNLSSIQGSGPKGRIIKDDVLAAQGSATTSTAMPAFSVGRNPEEYTIQPVSNMRKVIASRLLESKQTVPHFYLSVDCNIDALMAVRKEMNGKAPKNGDAPAYKISVNDFVIKASAQALRQIPAANASWTEDGIMQYNNIDISIAVAIQDGLITPIVKNADQKTLSQISNEMKDLASRARSGGLAPEEYQGGGFSISNLGMYGIKNFNAIVNPPQASIIAVGAAEERVIVKNGEMKPAMIMNATLSCDHRVIDGAVGAELLQAFKNFIENPAMMLV